MNVLALNDLNLIERNGKGIFKMIKAVNDKIVVEELKRTKTEGGIIIPEGSGDPQAYGKVLSLGEDIKTLKVGDIIVFHNHGGQAGLIGKSLLRILKYEEIYGILEHEETIKSLVHLEIGAISKEGTVTVREPTRIIH